MSVLSPHIVAFGECMIELRHLEADVMRRSFGGDTLNTAIYLARLAGSAFSVGYATAIGDHDPFSRQMLQSWQAENIDTRWVSQRAGELPGLYTIEVDQRGERSFCYWRQSSAARNYFNDVSSPLERGLDQVDVFYLSGISLAILPEAGRQRLFALMTRLRQHGGRVVFDNNYRPRLWSAPELARQVYAQAYACADIALLTLEDEMALHQSQDEAAVLAKIIACACPEITVKRGADSVLLYDAKRVVREVHTEAVSTVVDTTAAGDSFAAAYLAARLRGYSPQEAALAGNCLAARVIQHPGAIIPRAEMPASLLSV
ncbi:sugar kinase [Neisseriaceae bacterium TC5R-5]|nr:sugar kinase [Neisseriaceae bacterium TC5R-5]